MPSICLHYTARVNMQRYECAIAAFSFAYNNFYSLRVFFVGPLVCSRFGRRLFFVAPYRFMYLPAMCLFGAIQSSINNPNWSSFARVVLVERIYRFYGDFLDKDDVEINKAASFDEFYISSVVLI